MTTADRPRAIFFGSGNDTVTIPFAPTVADTRARQLREHSGFPNAGVYDPPSVNGTHVIYVLHDITRPEMYGGLPAHPRIPVSFTLWKRVAKPIALLLGLFAAPVAFFHYIAEGPKESQPPAPDPFSTGFGEPGPHPPGREVPR